MEQEYIVIAFTENQIGVLNRITGLYLRRKINIESLKVSESSIKGISMFVISAFTTHEIIERLVKQLRNIIDVIQVEFYSNEELITQEIALYKISAEILRQSDTGRPDHPAMERPFHRNQSRIRGGRENRDARRDRPHEGNARRGEAARRIHTLGQRRAAPRIGGRETAGENIGYANPARVHTDSIRYLRLLANGCRCVSGKQTGERDHLKSGQTKK